MMKRILDIRAIPAVNYVVLFCALLCTLLFCQTACAFAKEPAHYLRANHARFFYQSFGKGDPIIVLHGGPGLDSSYLLPQMVPLAAYHRAIFYDQRGSGKSLGSAINEKTINMKHFVADLDAIRHKFGYNKIILVGHSWGGLLAMNYAIKHPQHVSALILVNTAPASHTDFLMFVEEYDRRMASILPKLIQIENSKEFRASNPKAIERYYRLIFSKFTPDPAIADHITLSFTHDSALDGMKVGAIMQKTYLSTKFNILDDLKNLRIRTLIVHGEEDVVPIETAQRINQAIQGSEFVVLKNCGHFAYVEQPEEFFHRVNKFLR